MIVIGLTGSIGVGKSTTAAMLRKMGCAVHSADAAVHRLLAPGGAAVPAVAAAFPTALRPAGLDRQALGALVFDQPERRRILETILHPLVQQEERKKHARALAAGRRYLVLDIPLLFETGGDQRCHVTFCVSARPAQQRARVLARPGMTEQKFQAILAAQLSDAEKRARADYTVTTAYGRCVTWWQLRTIMSWLPPLEQAQHRN